MRLFLMVAFCVPVFVLSAAERDDLFGRLTFDAGTDCVWLPVREFRELRVYGPDASYIARPRSDGDRAAWLEELRAHRRELASGAAPGGETAELRFAGVRSWVRLGVEPAKSLALRSGDVLVVALEARAVSGENRELCFSFDTHRPDTDAKVSWTGINAVAEIPAGGAWHPVRVEVPVPEAGPGLWLRPIIGLDATRDATPGTVAVRAVRYSVPDAGRTAALGDALRRAHESQPDRGVYDRPEHDWVTRAFTSHFTFMYDRSFYDPESGYRIDALLDEGDRRFGGYDVLLLWHAYPRLGFDDRNQADMYRDMPGGLAGLRAVVDRAHARGTRVFINYNPWDTGTRPEPGKPEDMLAEIVRALDADGVFLDTMVGASPRFLATLEAARPGIVLCPEGRPDIGQLGVCTASWSQWTPDPDFPGLEHRKWLEPRHMLWQIRRWDLAHLDEIRTAFFNGSGMLVWENVFGTHNPWPAADARLWKRLTGVLRGEASRFASADWDPFYPAVPGADDLFIHRWPGPEGDVFTVVRAPNDGAGPATERPLFDIPRVPDRVVYDLLAGAPARAEPRGDALRVFGRLDPRSGLGCFGPAPRAAAALPADLPAADPSGADPGEVGPLAPLPVGRTAGFAANALPRDMVIVPGGPVRLRIEHVRRECGCYPDPGTAAGDRRRFTWGSPYDSRITHDYEANVAPFAIDRCEVTNAEFREFLRATGYKPGHSESFLKHWPNGTMPERLADHPVVYVDIDDARTYAAWAGKRLPTEPEWHLAAQGTDGRKWPWGDEFDPARVNGSGATVPADSLPAGRSPFGCHHMSGNVWELTESVRDDGHTRSLTLRGGSFYEAKGSVWYADGGPRPCDHHAKFILMWPGLDRCATVGFRCAADLAPEPR